jgi:hypothetical protein
MRSILALALILAIAAPTFAATPFADVPKTHWAYDAINKAVDAGILQGYDGKFHGQRLLNRYQMAVIVAKLLEAVKTPEGMAKATAGDGKTIQNIEALTTEFADELALLNTKVTTLEGTTQELKKDIEGMKSGDGGAETKGLGFTAFASFGLISTDKKSATANGNQLTRYQATDPDSLFFTLPQASIGVDKEVNPGVFFHAQFDYASDVSAMGGTVHINEAYFFVDEIFGDIGGKVGAFALPFSMEHNGPFRSCNYTITPSIVNTLNEAWRGYGIEFQKVKDVEPSDIIWKVGIVSGTDTLMAAPGGTGFWTDAPVGINQGEADDRFGYYLYVGKKPEKEGFGWNLSYFDNGGDKNATLPHIASADVNYWQIGLEWWGEKFGVMAQYIDGDHDFGTGADTEFSAWYALVNFKIDDKNNVSARYDSFDGKLKGTALKDEITGFTFAFNHKVTENSLFQLEYLTPDEKQKPGAWSDQKDDLVQLRYKVHF